MKKLLVVFLLIMAAGFSAAAQTIVTSDQSIEVNVPNWRIAFHGGVGYRLAKVADTGSADLNDYLKKLKLGYTYGGDITYFFSETLGAGIKVNDMHSSQKADVMVTYDDGSKHVGRLSDAIDIMFVGPMLSYRSFNLSNRNAFYMNYAFGYVSYLDDAELMNKYSISGGTLGYMAEVGYDMAVSENLSFGLGASLFGGVLTSYTRTEAGKKENLKLDKESYEGLGYVSLSLGLRYSF